MHEQVQTKTVVSVAEMARMVGLSRARFYQLMGETFPRPLHGPDSRRPFYTEELQNVCLEVRRRNCGVNGKAVLFYARGPRPVTLAKQVRTTKAKPPNSNHADLLEGLASLGLASVAADQIDVAVKALYPNGLNNVDRGEALRAVFLYLKRQISEDNVGR